MRAAIYADPDGPTRAVFGASEGYYSVSDGTHNWCITNAMEPNLFKVLNDDYGHQR